MADKFFIAPYDSESGQQTNVRPWLIPDEAFQTLTNAYVFRGRVRKRFGSRWLGDTPLVSRFRVQVDTTDNGGSASGTVPTGLGTVGQMFSIGDNVFTVQSLGTPTSMPGTGSFSTAQFNTSTGAFSFTGTVGLTPVYWYPALPVMGLLSYEGAGINNESVIGFDTKYAYQYNNGWMRLDGEITSGAATWTGSNSEFFWATTWSGVNASDRVFFVTNFNENEPNYMRAFSTTSPYNNRWDNFRPLISTATVGGITTEIYFSSAQIIVPFHNRLVAFNIWETTVVTPPGTTTLTNYANRATYSQVGSPLDADAFRRDIPGRGNAIDASTTEAIVTVEFVKDRLVVFFEQSTWEFVYTGNQAYPFIWQQINTELGAESTFSIVPFDKVALGVGNVGIMACNGTNTERIDEKIPTEVFDIHNADNGVERVYGIRDYFVEMVYWTFPSADATSDFPYPNRVLVYNYKNATWSFNDDSITAFGYFQPSTGVTWNSVTITWDDQVPWDSGSIQSQFRQVIAGNQEGYTFICDSEITTNASVLQITNIISTPLTQLMVIDHNFRVGEYIFIEGAVYDDASDGLNNQIFMVTSVIDKNNFTIGPDAPFSGNYLGGGLIARVSNIDLRTKEYNFYAKQGRNSYVSKVDFMVDSTASGAIQVNFYVSTAITPLLQDSAGLGCLLGTGTLDTFPYTLANNVPSPIPFEETAVRLWHPVYFQADGEVVQLQLTMNDAQMRDIDIRNADFQLHAMCITAMPTSYRFQ